MYDSGLRFAECVCEGHPDKMSDIISDSILDEYLEHDRLARVACETIVAKNMVVIAGEFSSSYKVDYSSMVKKVLKDIGYTTPEKGISPDDCDIVVSTSEQSENIQRAIIPSNRTSFEDIKAGDQSIVVGYAAKNDTGMIPPETYYAKKIVMEIDKKRKDGSIPYLWPDGKTLLSLAYDNGVPTKVHTIIISVQHEPNISGETIKRDITEEVVHTCVPSHLINKETMIIVNPPTGYFSFGGPAADTGLTGRKLISDTYGPNVPHGGGAFSGKDPTKIDRCGAYAARYVAKMLVQQGVAQQIELRFAYLIGESEPIAIDVETFNSSELDKSTIIELIREQFDLGPGLIIKNLNLLRPLYAYSTRARHFGMDMSLPWENCILSS